MRCKDHTPVQLGERMILRRLRSISFRERIPTFMCVVQAHILDDAQKGPRMAQERLATVEMAVEELSLGPTGGPNRL